MQTIDALAQILKREGIQHLSCYPTTSVIEACAAAGIRPIICRQERVGVGIADGFSRVTEGAIPGVFAMQYGPGAENAYAGVATAFSDSSPVLLLPLGHPEDRQGIYPLFNALRSFESVTKRVDRLTSPGRTADVMRRAFVALRSGRPGPVMVEVPADVATQEAPEPRYDVTARSISAGDPYDIERAARALCAAERPVVLAGQGVLYASATPELVELAELLSLPVTATLLGKSAFPETHALSLGCGTHVMPRAVHTFLQRADLVLAIGTSLTKHFTVMPLPKGFGVPGATETPISESGAGAPEQTDRKVLIHATNDPVDLHKDYVADFPIVGDAKLVLRQLIDAVRDIVGPKGRPSPAVAAEIAALHTAWLVDWQPKLTSAAQPIDPYRVIWELTQALPPEDAIVTHDSGNPRGQLVPFYRAAGPRGFLGWGKSHGLGSGLGLVMGAKLAKPEKICVNVMGDAAFGMVGMDFEAAARCRIPIITVVLNNGGMASEARAMPQAEAAYGTSTFLGRYADIARALGGRAERIEDPAEIAGAIRRAITTTREEGLPVLLEFITARETGASNSGRDFKPR